MSHYVSLTVVLVPTFFVGRAILREVNSTDGKDSTSNQPLLYFYIRLGIFFFLLYLLGGVIDDIRKGI